MTLDEHIFFFINKHDYPAWLDQTMLFISNNNTWIVLAGLLVALTLWRRSRALVVTTVSLIVALGVGDFIAYQMLKPAIGRLRPCYGLTDVRLVQSSCGGDFGMPSNHAVNAMAAAIIVLILFGKARPSLVMLSIALAFLVGFSRVYLGVHYPGDILAGFFLGGLCGFAVGAFTKRYMVPNSTSLELPSKVKKQARLS